MYYWTYTHTDHTWVVPVTTCVISTVVTHVSATPPVIGDHCVFDWTENKQVHVRHTYIHTWVILVRTCIISTMLTPISNTPPVISNHRVFYGTENNSASEVISAKMIISCQGSVGGPWIKVVSSLSVCNF